jgi:hypothetical protein
MVGPRIRECIIMAGLFDNKKDTQCPCLDAHGDCCNVTSLEGYHCTLDEGHDGDHIACGVMEHYIDIWPNEGEPDV